MKKNIFKTILIFPALIWVAFFTILRFLYEVCSRLDARINAYMDNLLDGEDDDEFWR
jgi:hypothetical protein